MPAMTTLDEVRLSSRYLFGGAVAANIRATRPAILFFLLSLMMGSVIAAMTPPLRGPDEAAHFLRAYGIARGAIVPSQGAEGRKGILMPGAFFEQYAAFETRYA